MSGNHKGSSFERDICKQLSIWWSGDEQRDDIFWRSSQSGGRATIRSRKGRTTAGSYGDITAIDKVGEPLIKVFTIELKRGKSHGEPGDLLDCKASPNCHKWMATMRQAISSAREAKSLSWMIIVKRDFRETVVFFPTKLLKPMNPLGHCRRKLWKAPYFRYKLIVPEIGKVDFVGIPLKRFIGSTKPHVLIEFGR